MSGKNNKSIVQLLKLFVVYSCSLLHPLSSNCVYKKSIDSLTGWAGAYIGRGAALLIKVIMEILFINFYLSWFLRGALAYHALLLLRLLAPPMMMMMMSISRRNRRGGGMKAFR